MLITKIDFNFQSLEKLFKISRNKCRSWSVNVFFTKEIVRDNTKGSVKIDIQKAHLPFYQMWAYPAVVAPEPIRNEVCKNPEKY